MKHEEKNREMQAAAGKFWENPRPKGEHILVLEPYMVVELLRVMPDGKMMEVYFSDGK